MSVKPVSYISRTNTLAGSKSSSAPFNAAGSDRFEARLQHLSDSIIQRSPYLLTIPTSRPYQPHSTQLNDWRRGSPFDAHEEQLQYLSFLPRDPAEDLLIATGGWDNEKGEMVEHLQAARSGTSTPQQSQGQVKKIPFSHYKTHKAGNQPLTKETTKTNGVQVILDPTNASTTAAGQPSAPPQSASHRTQNRSHHTTVDGDSKSSQKEEKHENTLPATKFRASPPPSTSTSAPPQKEKPSEKLRLPRLLSPTLPPSVEEELSRIANLDVKKTVSVPSSVSVKQAVSNRTLSPARSSQESNAAKERVKVDSKSQKPAKSMLATQATKRQDTASHHPDPKRTQHPQEEHRDIRAPTGARKEPAVLTAERPITQSKIVKLKFSKRRKDLQRFLQFPPRAKKLEHATILSKRDEQSSMKSRERQKDQDKKFEKDRSHHDAEKPTFAAKKHQDTPINSIVKSAKSTEKRRRTDDDAHALEPQTKRQKPINLDLTRKPQTPVPPPFRSPALSQHNSAQKPQTSTPVQEVKSIASRYIESMEMEAKTPQVSGRNGTPLAPGSVEKANGDGRSTSHTSSITSPVSGRSDDVNAWRAEQKRFTDLGRVLKHVADDLFKKKEKPGQDKARVEKQAIATAIETVLCYILAFTSADYACKLLRKPRDETAWRTLLPYISYVKSVTTGHTLLHGLCLQIEAVCRNSIQALDMVRLEHQALPPALPEESKAPTPNGNHDGKCLDPMAEALQARKDYMDFKSKLVENARVAQQLWMEGSFELSVDDLQQSFPTSWKRKSRAPLARSKEKLTIGSLGGDFYLPLSSVSTGIEAARAGWSLLSEWCKREDVKWEGRLGL